LRLLPDTKVKTIVSRRLSEIGQQISNKNTSQKRKQKMTKEKSASTLRFSPNSFNLREHTGTQIRMFD